jgi:hypothetical protein
MIWLAPAFLIAGGAIALPVLLHLLRRRPIEVRPFPSLRFLGPAAARETRRHRVRRWIVLALRCLLLLLLAAGFARPFWGRLAPAAGAAMVVVLDSSMSAQARGRPEALRDFALRQLSLLKDGRGDQAGLLVMDSGPRWVVPMTAQIDEVRAAVAAWNPGYGGTDYRLPFRIAGETLRGALAKDRILVWAADNQRAGWAGFDFKVPAPAGVQVRMEAPFPAPPRQAAIVRSQMVRSAEGWEVRAEILGFSPSLQRRTVTLEGEGGRVLATRILELQAGQAAVVTMAVPVGSGSGASAPDRLRVQLDPDDLAADDSSYVVLPAAEGPLAVLDEAAPEVAMAGVLPGADYLRTALEAAGNSDLAPIRLERWPRDGTAFPAGAVVIARHPDSFAGARGEALSQWRRQGGAVWVLVNGAASQIGWLRGHGIRATPSADIEKLRLRDWNLEHPLLAPYQGEDALLLLRPEFRRGWKLEGEALLPLARWGDRALAVGIDEGATGPLLVTGFDATRASGNWPLLAASFVPFAHQAVLELARRGSHQVEDLRVGRPVALPGSAAGTWEHLEGPGSPRSVPARGAVLAEVPGVYRFSEAAGPPVIFAINPPAEESDLAPWPRPEDLARLESKEPAPVPAFAALVPPDDDGNANLWWFLLALAGILLATEVMLANRTSL